jgi:N-acetylmuramoyl-L-alanine amidase
VFKLFLDPGHGGTDPGAEGNGLKEKDVVLDISLRIRDLLQTYQNVEVKMSRTTDMTVSLADRVNEANSWGADYFLSIHLNADSGLASGYEDYIYSGLSDSSQTAFYRNTIHAEVVKLNELTDRGKKKADFYVLRNTKMPALLTENGFIDYSGDAAKLKDPAYRNKVAQGHVNGLANAFHLQKSVLLHEVIVDGKQIGAFQEDQNVLNAVQKYLDTANQIEIKKASQ